MKKKEKQEQVKKHAIDCLHELLKPGSTVYTVLRHVSSSGMNRQISVCVVNEQGKVEDITCLVAHAMPGIYNQGESRQGFRVLKVSSCGMDMGFEVVYNLGYVLFPNGFKPADAGHSIGRNGTDANKLDKDGGYALRHEWL